MDCINITFLINYRDATTTNSSSSVYLKVSKEPKVDSIKKYQRLWLQIVPVDTI